MGSKKLGRGLDALLTKTEPMIVAMPERKPHTAVSLVDPDRIFPSHTQPRESFDHDSLKELAASIKENGVLQPIIVRTQPEGYEIIAGERRWRACQLLDMTEIPVIVRDVPDSKMLELAIIENIQREDLNPIEQALAYQALVKEFKITQEQVAKKVGKKRSTIANFMRLLELPDAIREYVSRGTLSMGHGRALLGLDDEKAQITLAEITIKENLSVRELEAFVSRRKNALSAPAQPVRTSAKPPHLLDIEDRLRKMLGTKVHVTEKNGRGKIVIDYYSHDEFDRLVSIFS